MENLEYGIVVENTHPETKIKSSHFILQTSDKAYLQLALLNSDNQDIIIDFYVDTVLKTFLETFLVRKNDDYFKDSKDNYRIEGIYEIKGVDEIPFSFKQEDLENYINVNNDLQI